MKGARRELIEVQRRLVRRIKREINESIGALTPELARYKKEYEREFIRYHLSDRSELHAELLKSDLVFVGDYHTLKHSQMALVRILEDLTVARRTIVLCVEMVAAENQDVLDAFMRGDVREEEFLRRIDYENSWGFAWSRYKPIFDYARKHDIRVVGINSAPGQKDAGLQERDKLAGRVVAAEALANPDAVVVVLDGDLHVAGGHLPKEVATVLGEDSGKHVPLTIFQNSERIYWKLVESHNERADVVRLRRGAFCIISSTPLVKYQSYLNWEANREELAPAVSSNWMLSDERSLEYGEQMQEIINTIADFFGIECDGLSDFALYTTGDLEFFRQLREEHIYSEEEIQEITVQILKGESYFITKGHIIYLGNLSLSHAAEEAAHFINHQCGGDLDGPVESRHDFYYRIMHEALGWLGSKIINPKRQCYRDEDYDEFLSRTDGRKLPPKVRETRRICRYVIQHRKMERKLFRSRRPSPTLKKIYRLPVSLHLGVTHGLGYMLGEKMYLSLLQSTVSREEIRDLFHEKYTDSARAFGVYLEFAERLKDVK